MRPKARVTFFLALFSATNARADCLGPVVHLGELHAMMVHGQPYGSHDENVRPVVYAHLPAGPDEPATPALRHPRFGTYLEKLRELGVTVYVDPSIYGAGGMWRQESSALVLAPGATWATFRHEYHHVLFTRFLTEPLYLAYREHLAGRGANPLPVARLRELHFELDALETAARRNLAYGAPLDECLSVAAETRAWRDARGWQRWTAWRAQRAAALYALVYERHWLEQLPRAHRTDEQERRLLEVQRTIALDWQRREQRRALAIVGAGLVTAVLSGYLLDAYLREAPPPPPAAVANTVDQP